MIEYVTLDYDGEPVTIEDGEILEAEPPYRDQVWNPESLDWEDAPAESEYGNDARDYGRGWYDCNSDWRKW